MSFGSLSGAQGQSFPLHAGAASKILLADADDDLRETILGAPLERFTETTIVNPSVLRDHLQVAREARLATDQGEYLTGIHAVAAPITDREDRVVAAVSVAYVAERRLSQRDVIRDHVIEAAYRMSEMLRDTASPRSALSRSRS